MTAARMLYHLARADFLERVRRYSFLLTLVFAGGLVYGVFTGAIAVQLDEYRGVYNSAWAGSMMTLVTSTFITLAGFYIVKNTLQRDGETRVGLVLATTPLSRSLYTLGKALSNFAVLSSLVGVLAAGALILQLARAESGVEPLKLLAPFVFVALPAMAVTAAVAVLFETMPLLRGGVGNLVYFFAWMFYLVASGVKGLNDYLGFGFFMHRMVDSLKAIDPAYKGDFGLQAGPTVHTTKTFLWTGVDWTVPVLLGRLQWVAVAIGIAWIASLFFHRFDPARATWRIRKAAPEPEERRESAAEARTAGTHLTPLAQIAHRSRFAGLVISELRLMLKGHGSWWYLVAAGLCVAGAAVSDVKARQMIAGFAWVWPVLVWSQMGARESRNGTGKLMFSCARTLGRQLPALWVAGFVIALATNGGFALRLLIDGSVSGFAGWLAGALFIPSLALALGVWSGSSKLFEALYTLWWYIGPMNHTPGLDFTGSTPSVFGTPFYLAAALTLIAAAYIGRRGQLGYA